VPLGWRLAGAGGLAAVAAGALLVAQAAHITGERVDHAPPALVPAAQILHDAATAARSAHAINPRPDQFVFIERASESGSARPAGMGVPAPTSTGGPSAVAQAPSAVWQGVTRTWLSADGTADGLIRSRSAASASYDSYPIDGCRDGHQPERDKAGKVIPGSSRPCVPQPGYLGALPTSRTPPAAPAPRSS